MKLFRKLYKRFLISLLLIWVTGGSPAQEVTPVEYQIKGAFLFNFAQFTEWPTSAFPSQNTPFVIGILGENPFSSFLEEFLKEEVIRGHPVVLRQFQTHDDIDIEKVHLLFIHRKHEISPSDLLALSAEKKILTVSDAPEFTRRGGVIRFFQDDNKVRFEINLRVASEANLLFSSKVLRLAVICCESE